MDTMAGVKWPRAAACRSSACATWWGRAISREADHVVYSQAGAGNQRGLHQGHVQPALRAVLLTLYWGRRSGRLAEADCAEMLRGLQSHAAGA
jgi:glucosamine--fructose-6-phosphate aminotransferase (isomerizing)